MARSLFTPHGPLQRTLPAPARWLGVALLTGLTLWYLVATPHMHTHPFGAVFLAVMLMSGFAAWWETGAGAVAILIVLTTAPAFDILPDELTLFFAATAGVVWMNRALMQAQDEADALRAEVGRLRRERDDRDDRDERGAPARGGP